MHKNNSFFGLVGQKIILAGVFGEKTLFFSIFAQTLKNLMTDLCMQFCSKCLKSSEIAKQKLSDFFHYDTINHLGDMAENVEGEYAPHP